MLRISFGCLTKLSLYYSSKSCAAMRAISPRILFSFSALSTYFVLSLALIPWRAEAVGKPQVTVIGMVYCDICSNNTFSNHGYFLPGVQVKIECTFKASSPKTTEEISFDVTRSTNRYGIYQLHIPSMDGVECATEGNRCRATLMRSSTLSCNVPGTSNTSDEVAIKSTQENTCIYSLDALNYRPSRRNMAFCGP